MNQALACKSGTLLPSSVGSSSAYFSSKADVSYRGFLITIHIFKAPLLQKADACTLEHVQAAVGGIKNMLVSHGNHVHESQGMNHTWVYMLLLCASKDWSSQANSLDQALFLNL